MDDFDKDFNRTTQLVKRGMVVSTIVGLIILAVVIWAVIKIVSHLTK